jgi:large subunit ribosomal protein L32
MKTIVKKIRPVEALATGQPHAHLSTMGINRCYCQAMPVPKRKMSRSNTRHRRSQWAATAPELVTVRVAGVAYRVPRRLAPAARRGLLDLDRLPGA